MVSPHQVRGDAEQPRPHGSSLRVVRVPVLESPNKRLSAQIVRKIAPDPPVQVAVDRREVPVEQFAELVPVGAGGQKQFLVGYGHLTRYLPAGRKRVLWQGHTIRRCSRSSPQWAGRPDGEASRATSAGHSPDRCPSRRSWPPPPGRWLTGVPGRQSTLRAGRLLAL